MLYQESQHSFIIVKYVQIDRKRVNCNLIYIQHRLLPLSSPDPTGTAHRHYQSPPSHFSSWFGQEESPSTRLSSGGSSSLRTEWRRGMLKSKLVSSLRILADLVFAAPGSFFNVVGSFVSECE